MIYIECNPDLELVRITKQIPRSEIIHELKGKYEICKRLKERANNIALLDEDPASNQPLYLNNMLIISLTAANIRLLYDKNKNNYIVLLLPRLEEWVIRATIQSQIDIRKYNLSNSARELHHEINYKIDKFEKLVMKLNEIKSPMVISLKAALNSK